MRVELLTWTGNHTILRCIFINQGKYVKELLKKYELDSSKYAKTPMASNYKFNLDSSGKPVLEKFYKFMILSLLC